MENLAGVEKQYADKIILQELYLAGIKATKNDKETKGEVPFTFIGKIGKWRLERRWRYWSAFVDDVKDGMPLEEAMKLNNMKHPTDDTITLEGEIRAGGHAGGISPDEYVGKTDDVELLSECKRVGLPTRMYKDTEYPDLNYGQIAQLCNSGKINCKRYIDVYHIDTQVGLKEFATFLKKLIS